MMQTSSGNSEFVMRVAVDNNHEGNDPISDTTSTLDPSEGS